MEVHKGRKISQIGGDEWSGFIAHMHLTRGELTSFSFRRQTPRLAVIYINWEDEDDDPRDEALKAKGTRLSEDESDNLWYILPPHDDYVGMPFVTHLTRTNVDRHVMLTARGSTTNCAYALDKDGRTVFSAAGWNNFLAGKNLQVGHAILVTIRNTRRHALRMMVVINLI
ncbi:uncharacterized protein [Triticum aestivum]|uniref:uncharacterized protein n=1 Tax=Triticum aestivum TaxID=4565 RepID=UPI001D00452C|nr:uncharacterized protein LOC123101373 [Triticum aestivum]